MQLLSSRKATLLASAVAFGFSASCSNSNDHSPGGNVQLSVPPRAGGADTQDGGGAGSDGGDGALPCGVGQCVGSDGFCYGPCSTGTCTTSAVGTCGGPSAGGVYCCTPDDGSLAPGSLLVDLTSQQLASLCDSIAQLSGGYGQTVVCHEDGAPASERIAWPSQASCTRGLGLLPRSCTATAADLTACSEFALSCATIGTPTPEACAAVDACDPSGSSVNDSGASASDAQ
jgi:hypothetical protein